RASESPSTPSRHSLRQRASSLANVGSRPRSGGSTGFARSGMRVRPSAGRASLPTLATRIFLTTPARAHERREPFAEARRGERRLERLPDLCALAAPDQAVTLVERVPLGVEALADERQLALARLEARLDRPQLALALRERVRVAVGGAGLDGDLARARFERRLLALELDPPRRELLLDPPCLLGPRLELSPLGVGELALGRRRLQLRAGAVELDLEAALALGERGGLGLDCGGTGQQLLLARVERLRALERGALAGDDRIELRRRRRLRLLLRLPAVEPLLELGELALPGRDRLGALAGESQQGFPVEVDARVVRRRRGARRRPRVEALLPAVFFRHCPMGSTSRKRAPCGSASS